MKIFPKSRQSIRLLSLAVWSLLGIFCWLGSPYRLLLEWPEAVRLNGVEFVPGKDAILSDSLSGWPPEGGVFGPWILNQVEIQTGEVHEIYRSHYLRSYLLAESGRWLVMIDLLENHIFRVTLLEIETGRQFVYDLPRGDISPSMNCSPCGRFVGITDNRGTFWVFDLAGETPKFHPKPADTDGIRTFCDWGFYIDDHGHIIALRGTDNDPQSLTTLCRYERESERWHIIHEVHEGEMFVDIGKDKNQKIFAAVATKNSDKKIQIDAESGLPTDVQMTPAVDEKIISNRYFDWLEDKFPWLDISSSTQTIEYTSRSGQVYLLDSYALKKGVPYFIPIEPDATHPYVGYADDRGIHLWDDPPRRSIKWFLISWLSCGFVIAMTMIFATIRRHEIRTQENM